MEGKRRIKREPTPKKYGDEEDEVTKNTSSPFGALKECSSTSSLSTTKGTSKFPVASSKLPTLSETSRTRLKSWSSRCSNKIPYSSSEYWGTVEFLNLAFSSWIQQQISKTPVCDLSPICIDYSKYLDEIDEIYSSKVPFETLKGFSTSTSLSTIEGASKFQVSCSQKPTLSETSGAGFKSSKFSSTSPYSSSEYCGKVEFLNLAFSSWIQQQISKTPVCDLSPICIDYCKYLDETDEIYSSKVPFETLKGFSSTSNLSSIKGATKLQVSSSLPLTLSETSRNGLKSSKLSSISPYSFSEYCANVEFLNLAFSSWIQQQISKTTLCDLSPICIDYSKHLDEIDEIYSSKVPFESLKGFSSASNLLSIEGATKLQVSYSLPSMLSETSRRGLKSSKFSSTSPYSSSEYCANVESLNLAFSSWIRKQISKTPVCDLSPIFTDYNKYLAEIKEKYSSTASASVTASAPSDDGIAGRALAPDNDQKAESTPASLQFKGFRPDSSGSWETDDTNGSGLVQTPFKGSSLTLGSSATCRRLIYSSDDTDDEPMDIDISLSPLQMPPESHGPLSCRPTLQPEQLFPLRPPPLALHGLVYSSDDTDDEPMDIDISLSALQMPPESHGPLSCRPTLQPEQLFPLRPPPPALSTPRMRNYYAMPDFQPTPLRCTIIDRQKVPTIYESAQQYKSSATATTPTGLVLELMSNNLTEGLMSESSYCGRVYKGHKRISLKDYPPFKAIIAQVEAKFPGCFSTSEQRKKLRDSVNGKCWRARQKMNY